MTRFPWYVLLVPLVPVSAMYADAAGALRPDELLRSAVAAVGVAAALFAVACAFYRDAHKAALLVSSALALFLVFDPLYAPLEDLRIAGVRPARRLIAVGLAYVLLGAWAWRIHRTRRSLRVFSSITNVAVAGSLILPAITIGRSTYAAATASAPVLELPRAEKAVDERPSIYYVVFDRYGDERTMRRHGFDNTAFLRYLAGQGFYVARASRSNYLKTVLSLASSLNMSYLDPLVAAEGPDSENWQPVYRWVHDGRVVRFLKAQGYRYVHAGSWYGPTARHPLADAEVNAYSAVPRAAMRLLDSELMAPLRLTMPTPLLDERLQQWHRVHWQVEQIVARAADPAPTFTFLHILVPHSPFVFGPDGEYVTADVEARRSSSQNYVNQVRAANLFAKRLVDGILARAPSPPVIVIQGDEGPYPEGTSSADEYDWRTASTADLQEKSGILNAYYLPGGADDTLYPSISPVNTFRAVFNAYLGTALDMLPDRVVGHESERRPYAQFDLTRRVREPLKATAAVVEDAAR